MQRTLLRGGLVVDGRAPLPRRADVLIDGERIVAVGALADADAAVVDVRDRVVLPGFVDAHVHAEAQLLERGAALPALAQGVTTCVIGQDGCGWAPGSGDAYAFMRDYFAGVNGSPPLPAEGLSVAQLRALHDRRTAQNVAYLAPHGLIRAQVAGISAAPLTASQERAAEALVERALDEGAIGLSSGFDYVPSRYGRPAEMAALTRPVQRRGGVYVSHLSGYGPTVGAGLAALLEVALDSGVALHASHLWGPPREIEQALARAAAAGHPITFDMYPYTAGSSLLAMFAVPDELQLGTVAETVQRLGSAPVRARLEADGLLCDPAAVTICAVAAPTLRWAEGLRLDAAARRAGRPVAGFVCDLLVASDLAVSVVAAGRPLSDEELRAIERLPGYMAGSDGIYVGSHPHPRGAATFSTLLRGLLAAEGEAGWATAARRLSTAAVDRFGLGDRGRIRDGAIADLVVVDPLRLASRATYAEPALLAEGIDRVLVGGQLVFADGEQVDAARPGRWLAL